MNGRVAPALAIVCALAGIAFAAADPDVPQLLNYQGRLTDAMGRAITGSVSVGFGFFNAPSDGDLLYYEEHGAVQAQGGIFHVLIGNGTAQRGAFADIYAGGSVYLETTVDPQGAQPLVMAPRQRIASTVFALKAGTVAGLDVILARLAAVEQKLQSVSVEGDDIVISGANLKIVNGLGSTATTNGLGNLFVGYNELRGILDDRSGSHSILVGQHHNFSSYGSLIAGKGHNVSGEFACVSGGVTNTASGPFASVSGGKTNLASGIAASVSGGAYNTAAEIHSSVSGGEVNFALSCSGSVTGGENNVALAAYSCVAGGQSNTASGSHSFVGGGYVNRASGMNSSVTGGLQNEASGSRSSITGGLYNVASAEYASVTGGYNNTASGFWSSICGGGLNATSGYGSCVVGGGGTQDGDGNTAFADYSAILGGKRNIAGDPNLADHTIGNQATVGGGSGNVASGTRSSVSGGHDRSVSGQYNWRAGESFQDH